MSWQAWALFKLASLFAPDYSSHGALMRAIARDRATGPAHPPKRLRKRIEFKDERSRVGRVFHVALLAGAASPIRIFYIHGGAFVLDLQAAQWILIGKLLAQTGAKIVAPIYPLAPEHSAGEGLEMIRQAYLDLAATHDPRNIVIVGDSAGGGLALSLAHLLRDMNGPAPAAIVLFSPWLDVGVDGSDQLALERRDPVLTIEFLRAAGRMWAKDTPVNDPKISPLFGDQTGLPPMMVFTGSRDILDSDAKRLAKKAGDIIVREYPNMMHVWPIAPIPEGRRAMAEAIDFIQQHVAG
jgi:epsilon-lactone hydrolase